MMMMVVVMLIHKSEKIAHERNTTATEWYCGSATKNLSLYNTVSVIYICVDSGCVSAAVGDYIFTGCVVPCVTPNVEEWGGLPYHERGTKALTKTPGSGTTVKFSRDRPFKFEGERRGLSPSLADKVAADALSTEMTDYSPLKFLPKCQKRKVWTLLSGRRTLAQSCPWVNIHRPSPNQPT